MGATHYQELRVPLKWRDTNNAFINTISKRSCSTNFSMHGHPIAMARRRMLWIWFILYGKVISTVLCPKFWYGLKKAWKSSIAGQQPARLLWELPSNFVSYDGTNDIKWNTKYGELVQVNYKEFVCIVLYQMIHQLTLKNQSTAHNYLVWTRTLRLQGILKNRARTMGLFPVQRQGKQCQKSQQDMNPTLGQFGIFVEWHAQWMDKAHSQWQPATKSCNCSQAGVSRFDHTRGVATGGVRGGGVECYERFAAYLASWWEYFWPTFHLIVDFLFLWHSKATSTTRTS